MNSVNVTSQAKTQLPEEEKLQEKLRPKTAIYKHNLSYLIFCNFVTSKIKGIHARATILHTRAHVCAKIYAHLYIFRLRGYKLQISYKEDHVSEKEIVSKILRYLKTVPKCFAWKEHGGIYGTAGIPDIIACIDGKFYAFEVKTPVGKTTKLQEATIRKILACGGTASVVRSVDEVRAVINGSLQ